MCAQDRSWYQRADVALATGFDRLRLPRVGDNSNDFLRLQNLTNGHGNGLLGHFGQIGEPALPHLLATTGFVEVDNKVWFFADKIRRRVVKSKMGILSDPHK